jgi:thiol-disulfide isomerase/thioredoxin
LQHEVFAMTRTLPIPSPRPSAARRNRVLLVLLAALLPTLAACGGKREEAASPSPAPSTGSTTPAAAGDTTPVPEATPKDPIGDFQKTADFVLEIDGKPAPDARIYNHETPPYVLIAAAALPAPVLLNLRATSAETLDPAKVTQTPDGKANLAAEAVAKAQGPYQMDNTENVRFSVDGKPVLLKPRPPLLGTQKVTDLEAYSPLYDKGAAAYKPDPAVIAELKKQPQLVLLKVYFGSWCPHCKQEVPKLVRVEKELAGSSIHIEYYGLPPGFGKDPEAQRVKVEAVPTGIVYVGGREVGRLATSSWASPETSLRDIVKGLPPAG